MISDWITSLSMWQTLMAVSTATAVFGAPVEGAVPLDFDAMKGFKG